MLHASKPNIRFTARTFERLVRADVFGTHRIELIDGRIFRMPPQGDPHEFGIAKANRALSKVVPDSECLFVPGTLRLTRHTVVDPDLVWVACPIGTPYEERPLPLLVIEVSYATYKKDSTVKMQTYAQAGIRDYWIMNVRRGFLEIYRDPQASGDLAACRYASVTRYTRGESVALLDRPAVTFAVGDLLP